MGPGEDAAQWVRPPGVRGRPYGTHALWDTRVGNIFLFGQGQFWCQRCVLSGPVGLREVQKSSSVFSESPTVYLENL